MKTITKAMILFVLTIISASTVAQSPDEMQKWMDYMTPGKVHEMLAKSSGTWNEEITVWMAPGAPPMQSTAIAENKMILGGRYQESKHTGTFNGMPFEGYNLLAYDNAKKVLQSTWVDNMGTGIMNLEGTYDPATKTVTLKGKQIDPMTGKDMDVRETMKFVDDNTQLLEMYMVIGGNEFKSMEIKLTRKS